MGSSEGDCGGIVIDRSKEENPYITVTKNNISIDMAVETDKFSMKLEGSKDNSLQAKIRKYNFLSSFRLERKGGEPHEVYGGLIESVYRPDNALFVVWMGGRVTDFEPHINEFLERLIELWHDKKNWSKKGVIIPIDKPLTVIDCKEFDVSAHMYLAEM